MAVILGVALAFTALLLPLSVYPGLLSELAFFAAISSPFWMPAACLTWWACVDMNHEAADLFGPPRPRRRWLGIAALAVVLNCGLLWYGAPRRLAFGLARPAFEAALATAPPAYSSGGGLARRLGVYHVDRVAADARGGVYFQTRAGTAGFHTDKTTHGFSYRPNQAGSPFGDEAYALSHIVGDWYSFQASERELEGAAAHSEASAGRPAAARSTPPTS